MKSLLWMLTSFLFLGCSGSDEVSEGVTGELVGLCEEREEIVLYGEFHWDLIRSQDRAKFEDALGRCESCPSAPRCLPVRNIAGWYHNSRTLNVEESDHETGDDSDGAGAP